VVSALSCWLAMHIEGIIGNPTGLAVPQRLGVRWG